MTLIRLQIEADTLFLRAPRLPFLFHFCGEKISVSRSASVWEKGLPNLACRGVNQEPVLASPSDLVTSNAARGRRSSNSNRGNNAKAQTEHCTFEVDFH